MISWRPALTILLLALIVSLMQPAPQLVDPGALQTVATNLPGLGVHTRLTDEVEPWKIQRTLQMVREMGAPWIVEFFPWAYYQGADGNIAWEHPDLVMEHAAAQGLKVVARLGMTPGWARPAETPLQYLDATAYDDFAGFAAAFAQRYEGELEAIIIWNEPNLFFEWGYQQTTPADYVELLQASYPAIKAVNPGVTVLAGAMAPTLEPEGSPWGLNDLAYLQGMYDAGGAELFDSLAVHTYGFTFPPEVEPGPEILNFRRVELLREVMVANGDSDKKIFITETGWNDHPRWTRAVRPGQRISYTVDSLEYMHSNWPYVEMMAIWMFRTPAPIKSYMDYFTLVTPEFITKPLYDELKGYTGN